MKLTAAQRWLQRIQRFLNLNLEGTPPMSTQLDALTAEVARNSDVDASAVALLTGLKAQLDAAIASNDPAALQALSDALGASNQALADAVTANTPAAPVA